jgi:diaminopimelate epimerase
VSIAFSKYQGTGNDFIIIDARSGNFNNLPVADMCHRRFGIGADGLMLLKNRDGFDFEMVYYNSDGRMSSMCGNGGRCIALFAHKLGLSKNGNLYFLAVDGPHHAHINGNSVRLQMSDVSSCEMRETHLAVLNTGSPHYVKFIGSNPDDEDLIAFAHEVRYGEEFKAAGINVNLVQIVSSGQLKMRTYERGVENETYSCGTGVTAAAIAYNGLFDKACQRVQVSTPGGILEVDFQYQAAAWNNIYLNGPAVEVFSGIWP